MHYHCAITAWCSRTESNRGHQDLQSSALPTELREQVTSLVCLDYLLPDVVIFPRGFSLGGSILVEHWGVEPHLPPCKGRVCTHSGAPNKLPLRKIHSKLLYYMAHAKLVPPVPNLPPLQRPYCFHSSKQWQLVLSFWDLLTQASPKLECIYLSGTSGGLRSHVSRLSVGCSPN